MTAAAAKTLKKGDKLAIRGEVRKVHETGKWIEVQFSGYSLDIPVKDVILWINPKIQKLIARETK